MKILIIKPSSFGDIVQAVPCANALKQAYPGCEITWVVFKQWKKLLEIFPDIDKVITWDRKKGIAGFFRVIKEVRKTDYDLIVDLQGLLRSALLAKAAKGKVKIGVPGMKENSAMLIKEPYPENSAMNATLRNLEPVRFLTGKLFTPAVNISIDAAALTQADAMLKENGIKGKFTALLPFARGKGKDWSIENYVGLIGLMQQKYKDSGIVVLGSADDYGKIKAGRIADLCGKTDLKQLAAVLSKADLAIGADTGPMHLAAVTGTPSVFIFGNSDINETAPYIGSFSLLVNKKDYKDLNKITPDEVMEEAEKWKK